MRHDIYPLPPEKAEHLLPLLDVVHSLHVMHQPERYLANPDPERLLPWLQDWLSDADVHCLATGRPDLSGYLICEIERHPTSPLTPDRNRVTLHHISVLPRYQRQGIAQALIRAMRDLARTKGVTRIATTYASFNGPSAALMDAVGLRPVTILAEGQV